ncbi:hypothetical protein P175DRAFT_0297958 [Aspergillus ochraceoroseus IBT 24754]|uniref:Uncharacterized protein n=1 Tax=Aspergillus ochraceoroseus IBT 24754 TaxID=1392256 RepID=A0A2T5LSR2_9EURO|nr:uncharacterized protein P175DRAFT_0297958 [Aspergillus ochraceoroseus IBT 24754]PTU19320.1 hypothetical protein P175DRAFT_0297958 [Aspergillus ochraceoroseus IBT 24754]
MSRLLLSSAVRRLSRPHPAYATVSTISSSVPSLSFSASFSHSSHRLQISPSSVPGNSPRVRDTPSRRSRIHLGTRQQCATFSSSTLRPAVQVTQNPRVDDEGNPLMISISERAAEVRSTPFHIFIHLFLDF